jgi:hypothetical protein
MMISCEDATVKVTPEYVTNITPSNVVKINSNPYTLY